MYLALRYIAVYVHCRKGNSIQTSCKPQFKIHFLFSYFITTAALLLVAVCMGLAHGACLLIELACVLSLRHIISFLIYV